jgi:hypothetical protein
MAGLDPAIHLPATAAGGPATTWIRVKPEGFRTDSEENLSVYAGFDRFVSPIVSPGVKRREIIPERASVPKSA